MGTYGPPNPKRLRKYALQQRKIKDRLYHTRSTPPPLIRTRSRVRFLLYARHRSWVRAAVCYTMYMSVQWTSVTWYSKLIALVLFVALPFLGFWLGVRYGEARVTATGGIPAAQGSTTPTNQ